MTDSERAERQQWLLTRILARGDHYIKIDDIFKYIEKWQPSALPIEIFVDGTKGAATVKSSGHLSSDDIKIMGDMVAAPTYVSWVTMD